ncbi:hypothetical protein [Spirillospora sp. NPDC029432]|uniref:hypothetical protein n=1 Tax=Spirillospora sp. NPDC029432 TaxID=3154599 RepID=UPI0034553599
MRLRLAGGVVAAPGQAAWLPRPAGPVRLADDGGAAPGAAVALGPATAGEAAVADAVAELERLVRAGGVVAAGAGVALGGGFRSARLEGARGDQRDAVLAALKVLGVAEADRLGARAGFLVALFGPAVTKPVGAAAAAAIAEGRWAALHLATAASDLLGPEQIEDVLALTAAEGADPIAGGLPSVLAANLRGALGPVPRRRRPELLADLWDRVAERQRRQARQERLLATQSNRRRLDDLRARRSHHEDELALEALRRNLGVSNPSLALAARWIPTDRYWHGVLDRILEDAFAATALLHTAVAVADHGAEEGMVRSGALLAAADHEVDAAQARRAGRRVPGLTGLSARPATAVRDLCRRLGRGTGAPGFAVYVASRLAHARDYAELAAEQFAEVILGRTGAPADVLRAWARHPTSGWRERSGLVPGRDGEEWDRVAAWAEHALGEREPIESREDPSEEVGDLLWCADLMDALARLHGHEAAKISLDRDPPWLDPDPPAEQDPLEPPLDSVTGAVAGAAQLVALGGRPARGARTWPDFVASLRAGAEITAALGGEFPVPAALAAVDGAAVPGTGGTFRLARGARTVAEWANYMGNCIAGEYYLENAEKGRIGLAALYGEDGRIVANLELGRARPAARGWQITELAARFNAPVDRRVEERLNAWVATIPARVEEPEPPAEEEPPPGRPVRRRPRPRLLQDAGPVLGTLAEKAWADEVTAAAAGALAVLAGPPATGADPLAALTRLRRLGPAALTGAVRNALGDGGLDLAGLWTLTSVRPLRTAVDALDPALRDRFDNLPLLLGAAPLPGSLRRLARTPAVAPAYSMNLMALRLRAAIGRLVDGGDPAVARAVSRRTTEPLLCALVVAVTCGPAGDGQVPVAPAGTVTVPGFPATALSDEDGPWQRAFPDARELGADTGAFWEGVHTEGLRVPAAWLPPGGWNALWGRAHRTAH